MRIVQSILSDWTGGSQELLQLSGKNLSSGENRIKQSLRREMEWLALTKGGVLLRKDAPLGLIPSTVNGLRRA